MLHPTYQAGRRAAAKGRPVPRNNPARILKAEGREIHLVDL